MILFVHYSAEGNSLENIGGWAIGSSDCKDRTTSTIAGRFSGNIEVHRRASSSTSNISCCAELEILGSNTWRAPFVMFTFLLTNLTTSRDSLTSGCSAGLPVTSSSNTTPKLYMSICSVGFLLQPYSAISSNAQCRTDISVC